MADDINLDNLDRDREAEDAAQQEEETSFIDDNPHGGDSTLIIDGSNLLFVRPDIDASTSERPEGSVPNARRDAGVMKRYIIQDKKQFLKNGLGITVNKGDGLFSKTLFDELTITTSDKTDKINGAKYKGKKILILKSGKMMYSKATDNVQYVNEFKELLIKAHTEHQKTPATIVEEHINVDIPQVVMEDITDNVSERIESEVDDEMEDLVTNPKITNNELREIRGILNVKGSTGEEKIKFLKANRKYWKDKANDEKAKGNEMKSKLYDTITRIDDLKIDEIRLRLNQKPESEEVIKMVEEEAEVNDLTRFEKFKKVG